MAGKGQYVYQGGVGSTRHCGPVNGGGPGGGVWMEAALNGHRRGHELSR